MQSPSGGPDAAHPGLVLDQPLGEPLDPATARGRWVITAVVGGIVLALVAAFLGYRLGVGQGVPDEASADVGFARDMQTHHLQAVQLSLIVRDRTQDPAITLLANDIVTTQANQAGQMNAWLNLWGYPLTGSEAPMAWMSGGEHGSHGADATTPPAATGSSDPMTAMGMATPEQIKALEAAKGVPAEVLFLTLMRTHHQGGVAMAKAALARASNPVVLTLARSIETSQTAEIEYLNTLLAQRS